MILITGIGRCGTSTVARILHNKTPVCMGHEWPVSDKWNPSGYYECTRSLIILRRSCEVELDLANFHRSHGCIRSIYGIKNPKLCNDLRGDAGRILAPKLVIICTRDKEAIIKSMMTFQRRKSIEECEKWYATRHEHIDHLIQSDLHTKLIDFTEHRSDEDVLNELEKMRIWE